MAWKKDSVAARYASASGGASADYWEIEILSLEDEFMRAFYADRLSRLFARRQRPLPGCIRPGIDGDQGDVGRAARGGQALQRGADRGLGARRGFGQDKNG